MLKQLLSTAGRGLCCWLLLASGLMAAAGCGYRVVGSEPVSVDKAKATMAVPPFENKTMQVGLETVFANEMIRALQDRNVVRIKPGDDKADYLLLGVIKRLEHSSTAYLDIEQSLIRRATLTLEVTVKDARNNKIIWRDSEIIKSDYVANQFYGVGEALRDQGLRELSVRFSQRVADKISLLF